jgi:hypothetical protein
MQCNGSNIASVMLRSPPLDSSAKLERAMIAARKAPEKPPVFSPRSRKPTQLAVTPHCHIISAAKSWSEGK